MDEASVEPRPLAEMSLAARSVLVVLVGISGALGSIWGWGPTVMAPPTQRSASLWVLATAVAFVLVARWADGSAVRLAVARVGVLVVVPAATWGSAGRSFGFLVAASLVVCRGALVEGWAGGPRRPASAEASALALVVLVLAQALWVGAFGVASIACVVASGAVMIGHARRPDVLAPLDGSLATVGRVVAGATRIRSGLDAPGPQPMPLRQLLPRDRRTILAGIGAAAAMAPVFIRYASEHPAVLGFSDYETHLEHARRMELLPPGGFAPHPVFHLAVRILSPVLGEVGATAAVLGAAVAVTVWVLVWLCRTAFAGRPALGPWVSVCFGLGFYLVESPAMLASALRVGNPFSWAPANHMWLSPTDTLLVPFALVTVVLCARTLSEDADALPSGPVLGSLAVVAALVKPAVSLPLIVVLPLLAWLLHRGERWRWHRILWFLVPTAVVLAWQTWLVQTGMPGAAEGGIAIRPFESLSVTALDRADLLIISPVLVVGLCFWAAPRRYVREPAVLVSLSCLVVALGVMLLFNETGARRTDGTFVKPVFACWVVVHVLSWRFLVGEAVSALGRRQRPAWLAAGALLLVVSVVAGVLAYLDAVGVAPLPIRAAA